MTVEEFVTKIKKDHTEGVLKGEYGHALKAIASTIQAASQLEENTTEEELKSSLLQTYRLFGDKILDHLPEKVRLLIGK